MWLCRCPDFVFSRLGCSVSVLRFEFCVSFFAFLGSLSVCILGFGFEIRIRLFFFVSRFGVLRVFLVFARPTSNESVGSAASG